MARAEQEGLAYLFRLRMTTHVKRSLERAMRQSDWRDAGQGWEGKETSRRLVGWSRQRRIILLRRKLGRDLAVTNQASGGQLRLNFVEVAAHPVVVPGGSLISPRWSTGRWTTPPPATRRLSTTLQ